MAAGVGGACAIHEGRRISFDVMIIVEVEGKREGKTSEGTRKVPNS